MKSIKRYSAEIEALQKELDAADAVLIGAGSGLSASAGLTYSGARFEEHFKDFIERYHYRDMYSAGFYPYSSPEEYWAYWSRHIYYNRYVDTPKPVYGRLLSLVKEKTYFVLTTNVDHCFQKAGFDKQRLFYTQGDYGLWQCSGPCCQKTWDNEKTVREMIARQADMRVPAELVPRCPVCGRPMAMNLRVDGTFVEDEGWHRASEQYAAFLHNYKDARLLLLELGVGRNTPGIIKYSFWQMADSRPDAVYACINLNEAYAPKEIEDKAICINGDIGDVLERVDFC